MAVEKNGELGPAEKNLEVMWQAYELGQQRLLDALNEQRLLVETQMVRADGEADARGAGLNSSGRCEVI